METITENHKTETTNCREPSPEGHIYVTALPSMVQRSFQKTGQKDFLRVRHQEAFCEGLSQKWMHKQGLNNDNIKT